MNITGENVVQGLTVGIVGGLIVYWMTQKKQHGWKTEQQSSYKPTLGDVRTVQGGSPTCADCQCCGLEPPGTTPSPLASDYLCCSPDYAPTVSGWNLGVSVQVSCGGIELDSKVYRQETASSFPHGIRGPNTNPRPAKVVQPVNCHPEVCAPVDCICIV